MLMLVVSSHSVSSSNMTRSRSDQNEKIMIEIKTNTKSVSCQLYLMPVMFQFRNSYLFYLVFSSRVIILVFVFRSSSLKFHSF